MAFASVGTLGSANEKTSDTSITITTSATLEAGNLGVCIVAMDNQATVDGASTNIDTCADSAGNNWTKVAEYTETAGAALDGVTTAIFYVVAGSQLTSGGTITITADTATTAKAASAWEFTIDESSVAVEAEVVTQAHDAEPADAVLSGMASREYLLIHAMGQENTNVTITQDADYTALTRDFSGGGGSQTNVQIGGGFRIATLTGDTVSVATNSDTGAHAYILAALYEVAGGADHTGSAALPITVAIAIAGTRTRLGSAALPITLTVATAGAKTTFGASAVPITFGAATNGTRTRLGSAALPITFSVFTDGQVEGAVTGSASLAVTFGAAVNGTRTRFGAAALPVTINIAAAGTASHFATTAVPITLTIATNGQIVGAALTDFFAHPTLSRGYGHPTPARGYAPPTLSRGYDPPTLGD